ncbi:NADH-quinone oxidoreductase subunit NuoF [Dethiobacter alkaliphilus]|uniref:NADH dehydrogenase (Quinone) n=1 Tax=Dethiobacter alkaliphilus AHT 1 TaxID=555088 RepID=C0GH39_DETAL|nr:NADH-quinone oxidoreductase subunit NuoF [Dethiobacter alkaliphilus]EEG77341.1 NADH dehydrogenase (quinone) [Dethiobacter alkaliphilus AHT 1]
MSNNGFKVKIGLASCSIAAGAAKVHDLLKDLLADDGIHLQRTGCMGLCYCEPQVEVVAPDGRSYLYGNVSTDNVGQIVEEHIKKGEPVEELLVVPPDGASEAGEYIGRQERFLLHNCGNIDPENIESYLDAGGYKGLAKAVAMKPEEVIAEVKSSGLRGRGGAGFPTHQKWTFARDAKGEQKYIICNADEGDPGAFMDRSILESDPHSVLEGMMIAGYAIGASVGYIYIRAEYPLAIRRLKIAIAQAKEHYYLGTNILNSGFDFDIKIREGAGAFVCGEETALIASIEGKRGMPRFRPPFPAVSGLFASPTSINNVETFANVPQILAQGAAAYNVHGTEFSKGTKVFALAGKVNRGGLIEVPMGMSINDIVFAVGGGISTGKAFKAVQTGGPSGGCIPAELADTAVDYESLKEIGAIMGSGGLLIMDEETCMVDVAKFFLTFTREESCGKCTFCRVGTEQMLRILERITEGEGTEEDIDTLEDLGSKIKAGSLCGLGQTVPNPVLTTIKYFRDEYEAHVRDKVCPAKNCKALIEYEIVAEDCKGCGLCRKQCPVDAISGGKKEPHVIDQATCLRCGLCVNSCKFDCITVSSKPGKTAPVDGQGMGAVS